LKDLLEAPEIQSSPASATVVGPEPPKGKSLNLRAIVAVSVIVLALAVLLLLRKANRAPQAVDSAVPTIVVKRQNFVHSVRLTGTVEAVNFLAIAAPRLSGPGLGSLVITRLTTSGTKVSKGDLLVQFDQQQQIKNALEQEATYVDFAEQIKKKTADQLASHAGDESTLHQAENDVRSTAAEVRRNEILSKIDAEKNNLAAEQAKATYEQLRKTFALKRQATQAEIKSLEIQRDRARYAMEYARKNTGRLEIHAPIDGIVVLNSIWKGGQFGEVQMGDEVRAGVPFMQIVNPGAMQVRARVNQADVSMLRVGQPVHIGLDAYPDLSFNGKVERIAAIGVTSGLSDRVRTFNVLFSIAGSDARLMPDLSASLDVELQRIPNALTVPRSALLASGSDSFLMEGEGGTYSRKQIQVSAENDTEAVVSGIQEGARVQGNAAR
jgi:multidrug resistance efflux pump